MFKCEVHCAQLNASDEKNAAQDQNPGIAELMAMRTEALRGFFLQEKRNDWRFSRASPAIILCT
jgi:hypothetical protein